MGPLTYNDSMVFLKSHVDNRAPPLQRMFRRFRSLNIAAFRRLDISSNFGWRHVPGEGEGVAGYLSCDTGVTGVEGAVRVAMLLSPGRFEVSKLVASSGRKGKGTHTLTKF